MPKAAEGENLVEQFSVKCSLKTPASVNKPLECIPLLLCDVLCCEPTTSPSIFQIFDGKLLFRTIVLHARVVAKIVPSNKNCHYRFEIDDSTSVVPLTIRKNQEDINEIQRLQNEIYVRKSSTQRKDVLSALQRMLEKTKKQLDPSIITVGARIFIFGKPDFFRDQTSIFGFSWDLDEGVSRNMELAFKDELVEWYTNKYSPFKK